MGQETIVAWVVAGTFLAIFLVAWQAREGSWSLSTFFMGGRNIGAPLTAHAFWGTSFSFANGIYYFVALGFFKGMVVVWFQIPWIAAILFLAWKLPLLAQITDRYTLHGFLGSQFGRKAAVTASIVTIAAFMGMIAFEINVSSEIIARSLGWREVVIPLTIVSAFIAAIYVNVGGFLGAAKTDRLQNYFGLIAVAILIAAVFDLRSSPEISGGSALTTASVLSSLFDISRLDWLSFFGILCFAATTNVVDMSNWQAIAANSLANNAELRSLRWAMVRSAIWIFAVPAVAGTFIGYAFHEVHFNGEALLDTDILPTLIASLGGSAVGALVLGATCAGLIASALSTVDSYLLSTSQTIVWDIRREAETAREMEEGSEERLKFERISVRRARNEMYWYAGFACLAFIGLRFAIGDTTVFVLQFIIFGVITALFPATMIAIWLKSMRLDASAREKTFVTYSMRFGLAANLICLGLAILWADLFNFYALTPIATLGTAALVSIPPIVSIRERARGKTADEASAA